VELLLASCEEHGPLPEVVYLCDTVGAANPLGVKRTLDLVRTRWPGIEFALHLHDTRGMGLANVLAGLESGVQRFDTSIGAWAAVRSRATRPQRATYARKTSR
jgi:hydroxymethylglutaryl-CoA lyase